MSFGHFSYCKQSNIFSIVSPLQDIFKQATEDRLTSAKELPYFEGDFWPNVLEESIKELEQEEEERKREENSTSSESTDVSGVKANEIQSIPAALIHALKRILTLLQPSKGDSKNAKKKNNKKTSKNKSSLSRANKKKPGMPSVSNDLSQKLYATMEKHKEVLKLAPANMSTFIHIFIENNIFLSICRFSL